MHSLTSKAKRYPRYDKKSKMNNFELLFETFNALRVTFNSNIALQILDKKAGIAKKVLYELKMVTL